ncbi:hypothetical protein CVT26_005696 [Gymnopilus dilepis]|uniref:Uncharacterized protein n=1 Tax=Gymnopilus dilepis TaxID=231916 RepID=A0A409X8E0_9AGAR|nr:hypothetical protein CVT26_005696 [Gymnopilus dilepis]
MGGGSGEGRGEEGGDADQNDDGDDEGYSEEEEEFNEVLADAIFKRPASLGVRSSSSRRAKTRGRLPDTFTSPSTETDPSHHSLPEHDREGEKPDQLTEFTFPSLSDLGNVGYKYRGGLVAVNGHGSSRGGSTPESSASVSASRSASIPGSGSASRSASVAGSREMSISPVPVPREEEEEGSIAVVAPVEEHAKAEVAPGLESVPAPVDQAVEGQHEPEAQPEQGQVVEILYDSSTSTSNSSPSTDDTPRKESVEPLVGPVQVTADDGHGQSAALGVAATATGDEGQVAVAATQEVQ